MPITGWLSRKSVKTSKVIDAVDGDIVRACLDGGQRRLILTSSTGEIVIYGYLQVQIFAAGAKQW